MLKMRLVYAATALLASAVTASAADTQDAEATGPVIEAPAGPVRGSEDDGLQIFKGIPYALPPVGEARWTAPQPVPSWEEERDATSFGPPCVQPAYGTGSIYYAEMPPGSEDCLSLNIWAPQDAADAPVFVWIHGGSLWRGCSCDALYDGSAMARDGVVVVSINYRMGPLGYLAHPELSAESPDGVSGNYGLLDQIAALEWVRENIASFGGDPDNVTVGGESAGALSVMYLLAAPASHGLYSKAIAQSAYMITTPPLKEKQHGLEPAESIGARLLTDLGAGNITEARAMDAQELTNAASKAGYLPFGAVDGKVLPRQIVDTLDRGEQAQVPIMAGFNSGEIRSLRFLAPKTPQDAATYEQSVRNLFGDLADDYLALYPSDDMGESILATTRDAMYGWTAERLVTKQTELGEPAYFYLFDHGYPAAEESGLHGFHAAELPYVFGTADGIPPNWPALSDTPAEQQFSEAVTSYWTTFMKSGQPEPSGQPAWKAYSQEEAYMHFAEKPMAETAAYPGMYELHEEVVSRRREAGGIPWNWNVGLASPPLP